MCTYITSTLFLCLCCIGVVVCFDERTYSVIEGEEVTIGISANRYFTSSFTVTAVHPDPGLLTCACMGGGGQVGRCVCLLLID